MKKVIILFFGFVLLFITCNTPVPENIKKQAANLPDKIDFNYHIKPILSDRCFKCHGPDANQRKGNLRLDLKANALGRGESGKRAIVPENLTNSEVFQRIISDDPELKMPNIESKLKLTNYEIALIGKWIQQGANWKKHWAFIPPEKPAVPVVETTNWIQNPIDNFIMKRLEKENLSPSPKADKATLLRRVTLDLTGLPPTIEELDNFLKDTAPNAFEKVVNQLLASSHYGERMAANWMDVARYADSHGYLDDTPWEAWPWRDWVIKAFNENLPYNQFITWQIAGDLLPNATQNQRLATSFQRLHRQNQEGGILPEEYRVEYVAERVATTSKAFLGLTMECARCHDHKYDPISQKEFYQMSAFFNSTHEFGRAPIGYESGPTMLLTDKETAQQLTFINKKIAKQEAKLDSTKKVFFQTVLTNPKSISISNIQSGIQSGLIAHFSFDYTENAGFRNLVNNHIEGRLSNWKSDFKVAGKYGNAILFDNKNSVIFGKDLAQFDRTDAFSFSNWIWLPSVYKDASIFDNSDHRWHAYRGYEMRINKGKLQFRLNHNYPHNALILETKNPLPIAKWMQLGVTYNGSSTIEGLQLYINGQKATTHILNDHLYKSILHDTNNKMVVMPYFGFKVGARSQDPPLVGGKMDDLKIWNRTLSALEMEVLSADSTVNFLEKDTQMVDWLWLLNQIKTPEYQALQLLRAKENKIITAVPEAMVLGDQKEERPTYILNRGSYNEPGEMVSHGVPQQILAYNENWPKNRLGLAKWITNPQNPLTTRVAVNRFWQQFFGNGLVKSADDFGNQGNLPSHPKLLDWLALTFKDAGWDVKSLLRLIVLSATYQQSSATSEQLAAKDRENLLMARGPRYRLNAEMIRDQALAASGLWNRQIGGKSMKPYQPKGMWAEQSFQDWAHYIPDTDDNIYRRTLYIFWKRNTPHPYMTTFDIPDRAACTVKRIATSTPLQALMLLNYPQFPEASRALAEQILLDSDVINTTAQLRKLFRLLTADYPSEEELVLLKELYQKEKTKFQQDLIATNAFLSVGLYRVQPNLNKVELAALTIVAHSVMNTVGFYMKK